MAIILTFIYLVLPSDWGINTSYFLISGFEKKPSDDIPPLLEQYLRQIAKTGETLYVSLLDLLYILNDTEFGFCVIIIVRC